MTRETQLKVINSSRTQGVCVVSVVILHRYLYSFKQVKFSDYNVSLIYTQENRQSPITIQKVKSNAVL